MVNLNPFKKKKNAFDYKAYIFVPSVDSMQAQFVIKTKLWRSPDDNLLYLIDSDTKGKKFKELYPGENKKIFGKDELPGLRKKLQILKAKRKTTDKKGVTNPLNVEKEIYELEYLIAQTEEERGSFVLQNAQNEKCVYYLRKSTGLFALHFDIHSNKAFSPTETQSKDAFLSWKTKFENLKVKPPLSFEKITASIVAVILLVLVLAGGFGVWKLYNYDVALDKAMIDQKYICQRENIAKQETTTDINQETAGILNQYVKDKFLEKEKEIQTPQSKEVK